VQPVEYAPEYSHAERVRFFVLGSAAGALVFVVCQFWFFPLLREFSASAHCRSVLGISGIAVLFYGVFVGVPLHAALLLGALAGRRGFKVLREGRHPPSGEKVFRPTPVIRGTKAKMFGYLQLFAAAPLFGLAVWGGFQAQGLVKQAQERPAQCAPNPSIERTHSGLRPPRATHAQR
jgi:hypothetical protein